MHISEEINLKIDLFVPFIAKAKGIEKDKEAAGGHGEGGEDGGEGAEGGEGEAEEVVEEGPEEILVDERGDGEEGDGFRDAG